MAVESAGLMREVTTLLNAAEMVLQDTVEALHLSAKTRQRASDWNHQYSNKRVLYDNLEELILTLQHELRHFQVPFCAFIGGNDVEEMRNIQGHECLHVGDRFTITGNDTRSRDVAAKIWVSNPQETGCVMSILLQAIDLEHHQKRERNAEKEQESEKKDWKAEANATDTTEPRRRKRQLIRYVGTSMLSNDEVIQPEPHRSPSKFIGTSDSKLIIFK
ncbi:hypothetical protein PsorP6_011545 [Peronosclerospora sorghi]|uniref:Uncharacterized protein n=1 Tax=Peronosclerospora sorghi TaxID=230839 RepID=A0ACC0WM02_9STRA|nr:hypothetical protein PsorP6_011545 [Peronosclerospora sorghi]